MHSMYIKTSRKKKYKIFKILCINFSIIKNKLSKYDFISKYSSKTAGYPVQNNRTTDRNGMTVLI